jgi:sulfate permease, SulP family
LNASTETNSESGFAPQLVSTLKEGYDGHSLRADVIAGLTVAIVALPLSMAIAIASHVSPDKGLFTAIVGGFVVSALGGSRFQIGGPAGAFIVLVASIVDRFGFDGLLLATMMAGVMIFALGALRLGSYIKYVPHPVIVGFTAGIAIIIFASQIKELLGVKLPGAEPAALVPKLQALWQSLPTINIQAIIIAALTIVAILFLRKLKPRWPAFLIAVTAASLVAFFFHFDVQTIATKFGGIPSSLPAPHIPDFSLEKMLALLPDALAITLLGSIESLLSAVVADTMSGQRHRSNTELVAQGIANVACAIFGGIVASGTIARTATNVRAGAHGPISGMLHAAFLLLFMIVAAPLAGYIPLAALAGILAVVCWNMADKVEFKTLLTASRGEAIVVLATFFLTIFVDLTTGIVVGVTLGCLVFMHRMAIAVTVKTQEGESDPDIVVQHVSGAFFFGAASTVASVLENINGAPKGFILDLSQVPFVDYSAAQSLRGFLKKAEKLKARVFLTGASTHVRRELIRFGIQKPMVGYAHSIADCKNAIRGGHEIAEHAD